MEILFMLFAFLFFVFVGLTINYGLTWLAVYCLEGFGVHAPFWPMFAGIFLIGMLLGGASRK